MRAGDAGGPHRVSTLAELEPYVATLRAGARQGMKYKALATLLKTQHSVEVNTPELLRRWCKQEPGEALGEGVQLMGGVGAMEAKRARRDGPVPGRQEHCGEASASSAGRAAGGTAISGISVSYAVSIEI